MNLDPTGVTEAISAVATFGDRLIEAVFPDPEKRASAEAITLKAQVDAMMAPIQAQLRINEIEASSDSWFAKNWRPATGWVGVFGLAWNSVAGPMLQWVLQVCGAHVPPLPVLDPTVVTLLGSMLGINIGARTIEYVNGVARGQSPASRGAAR